MRNERSIRDYLNRLLLGQIAEDAKASCKRGDTEATFSAFLSEVATVKELRKYLP